MTEYMADIYEGADLACYATGNRLLFKNLSGDYLESVIAYLDIDGVKCHKIPLFDMPPYKENEIPLDYYTRAVNNVSNHIFQGPLIVVYKNHDGLMVQQFHILLPPQNEKWRQIPETDESIRLVYILGRKVSLLENWIFLKGGKQEIEKTIREIKILCQNPILNRCHDVQTTILSGLWQMDALINGQSTIINGNEERLMEIIHTLDLALSNGVDPVKQQSCLAMEENGEASYLR